MQLFFVLSLKTGVVHYLKDFIEDKNEDAIRLAFNFFSMNQIQMKLSSLINNNNDIINNEEIIQNVG